MLKLDTRAYRNIVVLTGAVTLPVANDQAYAQQMQQSYGAT